MKEIRPLPSLSNPMTHTCTTSKGNVKVPNQSINHLPFSLNTHPPPSKSSLILTRRTESLIMHFLYHNLESYSFVKLKSRLQLPSKNEKRRKISTQQIKQAPGNAKQNKALQSKHKIMKLFCFVFVLVLPTATLSSVYLSFPLSITTSF